ncbi:MAG: hypothetical protein FWD61_13070, partial [Phycisphaerales bacterium]|nr:hypothetical protein [Phycisphaerales bacterium]
MNSKPRDCNPAAVRHSNAYQPPHDHAVLLCHLVTRPPAASACTASSVLTSTGGVIFGSLAKPS